MLDSIYIGMSGLLGYSRGLRVIANNTANINTPGFKGASLQFGDQFYSSGPASGAITDNGPNQLGQGLATYSTSLDFSQGELRQTGNELDLAVDGEGLFTLKDENGTLRYSRDGEFKFDDNGFLTSRTTGAKVMGRDENGAAVEISLGGVRTNPAKATTTLTFRGNLSNNTSSATNTHTLTDVTVRDEVSGAHNLTTEFTQEDTTEASQVRWKVVVKDGTTEVGTGNLLFVAGLLDASTAKITVNYKPTGLSAQSLVLDFSEDVTSNAAGTLSDLRLLQQDGYAAGELTQAEFDDKGVLKLTYSNGQTIDGPKLALARFTSVDAVRSVGDNLFEPTNPGSWEMGTAQTGAFGSVRSGVVEISNVDLSSEFSDLVIMQRGYQASSQVVSTANEMIQELFSLRGR